MEEQAVARYGLGLDEHSWKEAASPLPSESSSSSSASNFVLVTPQTDDFDDHNNSSLPAVTNSSSEPSFASKLGSFAAKTVAPLASHFLAKAPDPRLRWAGALIERAAGFSEGVVPVRGVENCVYLDDSGSMVQTMETGKWFGKTRLQVAKDTFSAMAESLDQYPTRVVKFGSRPTVISRREIPVKLSSSSIQPAVDESSSASAVVVNSDKRNVSTMKDVVTGTLWDGSSGGTYLWHMIEQDVLQKYKPAGGRLRLFIVTDGEDTDSPEGYQGARGMDPMMKTLRTKGYDVEFFIAIIGSEVSGAQCYRDLARATGGAFLQLQSGFQPSSPEVKHFIAAMKQSRSRAQQEQYERDLKLGKAEKFDWYLPLPPPSEPK